MTITVDLDKVETDSSETVENVSDNLKSEVGQQQEKSELDTGNPADAQSRSAESLPEEAPLPGNAPETDELAGSGEGNIDEGTDAANSAKNEPRQSAGWISMIVAGFVGAVIAILLLAGLTMQGFGPFAENSRLPAEPSANTEREQLEDFRSQMSALSESVNKLQKEQVDMPAAIPGTTAAEMQSVVREQETILGKLAEIEAGLARSLTQPAVNPVIETRLDDVAQSGQQTGERVMQMQTELKASTERLEKQLQVLRDQVKNLRERPASEGLAPDIASIVAATLLKSAIDRGQNFSSELESYASLTGDEETLTALKDLSSTGVPTQSEIVDGFDAAADTVVRTSLATLQDGSLLERLAGSARTLVNIRPVGEVDGDTAPAIIARMEQDLRQGRLSDALLEARQLPEDSQKAMGDYINALEARVQADQLVEAVLLRALSAGGLNSNENGQ